MADVKKNQSKVYNALKGMGFSGIGANEEDFAAKMSNPKNREKVYKALTSKGYKGIGKDQAAFDSLIYQAPATPTQPIAQQPQVAAQPQPTEQPQQAPQQPEVPKQTYTPTWQEQMAFGQTINSAKNTVKGAKEGLDKTIQNLETYRKQQAVTGGVAKTTPKWNPETGEMEQSYITSAGTEHKNELEAADVQRRLNDAYWREAHPLEAAEREVNQDLRDIRTEEERLTEQRKAAEGGKRPEDKTWWDYFKENFGASAVSGMAPMGSNVDRDMVEAEMTRKGAYGAERQAIKNEQDVLLARRRLAEDARQLLADMRKDQQGYGVLGGFARAGEKVLETAINPHTWDFGEADMASQLAVAEAVIKSDSGLGTSSNEQKLLDTWAKNAAINSQFGDQLSGWTKAGMVTGESLPFMLEMAMNPASGLGEAATAQLVKYSLKKYGTKWVKDHAKSMLAKKIATRLIGDVVGSGVMASTTGAARVAADYERRMTGQVDIGMDANGDIIYNGIKQETKENPGAALFKAMSSTAIENWSEMAGNYLGFINSFFGKALGKTVIGKAGRKALETTGSIEGVSLNKAQKFIYDLAAGKGIGAFSEGLGQFAKRTQWHGVIGEYLEEEIGNIANAAIVGDMTFDTAKDTGVFNLEQNIDTFCGVALMGGFMSALNTIGFAAHKINYDVDRVSNANAQIFGDALWNKIKTTIDSSIGDPRAMNDVLTDLVRGDGGMFDANGKKAILKYTQAALEKQGAEMATYQPRMASSSREEVATPEGKQYVVTSLDKNGDTIDQQTFNSEDEAVAFEGELKMRQQQQDYKDYLSMANKLSYPEASQVVSDFMVANGIEADNAEAIAAINDPKSELGKQFQQFKMERILSKAQANQEAIATFEQENGWSPGTVQWLSEQDPMQLDAEGLTMADQARAFLEGLAYPAGEVHVEHEQQVGAEAAQGVVENVISEENMIDPQNNAGQQLLDGFVAADKALNELFERNEDLREEFNRLSGIGLSPQEIISSLDSFRPEEIQTVIDHFNAKARYLSFMDEAGRQIDNVARRNRERRTFQGTINGVPDKENVVTIMDDEGNSYTLVSGNLTADSQWNVTGSDSGLIIGVDANGDFVSLSDKHLSVMPSATTLDQYEDAERTRLQEAVTTVVDPNQAMNPNTQQTESAGTVEQGGILDNAGGEAVVNYDNGANNPPATAPSAPVAETQQQTQQPAVTIESVTDKDGIKRYENGIAVDDAIADIIASGDDVNEIADASIAEAQEVIDKINNKQIKTRLDIEKRKNAQRIIDYYNNVKARWAEVNAEAMPQPAENPANSEENVNIQPEQPTIAEKPVSSQQNLTVEEQKQQRIAEAKAKYGELFDDDFTKANDVYELVSMWVGRKRNLAWDDVNGKRGLQKELGWTRKIGGDTKYIETLLAKKGEGMGVDEFAHMVWESPENTIGEEKHWTTEEIKEALLDLIRSAESKSDIVDRALNTRITQAEAAQQAKNEQDEMAENAEDELAQMTAEQIADMEANLPFPMSTDKGNIVELLDAIEELSQQEGMPEIQLVDTDFMSDDDWYDLTSRLNDGIFVSQEQIEDTRSTVLTDGLYIIEETGAITVYSDSQTAEELKQKVEFIRQNYGRINEEETGGLETQDVQRPETGAVAEAQGQNATHVHTGTVQRDRIDREDGSRGQTAQGAGLPDSGGRTTSDGLQNGGNQETNSSSHRGTAQGTGILEGSTGASQSETESQGSTESVGDPYLQPRNAEEEQIIANVIAQLQQEIQGAIDEQTKARSELQKAQSRESERATDLFGNDNALNQPGQLFDNSDMPVDQSIEGVERRTATERQRLKQATDKLNRLQSLEERNSRIRGALDNHRRQTSIEDTEAKPQPAEQPTTDPMQAIEQAAQQFREEQAKKNYGAENKLVTRERYEELRKRMRQKLLGQANSGFDPEILAIGTEMAMFHIEAGARKFVDFAEKMIADLGDAIRPYLKAIYNGAREMPGMEELRKQMTSSEAVSLLDVQKIANTADNSVNEHKQENNEQNNSLSLHWKSVSKEQMNARLTFAGQVDSNLVLALDSGEKPFKSINDLRALAERCGMDIDKEGRDDILLQELVEYALVRAAKSIVFGTYGGKLTKKAFADMVKLYNLQPTIGQRSSNRIKMQQYSTPLPMSFVAQMFVGNGGANGFNRVKERVLEPTAGNGMLVYAMSPQAVHVNELDENRLWSLERQNFGKVTNQDATQPFEGEEQYDGVIANPPFGAAEAKDYDGKQISGLAEQIALNALSKMKDDGKAAIIIGGNMEYADNGAIKSQKAFFTYLYDHYNVKGVIDMDGKLYQKQGTTYPTRMILIDGRRSEEERAQTKVYPPVKSMTPKKATTFEELYDIAEKIRNNKYKTNGNEQPRVLRSTEQAAEPVVRNTSRQADKSRLDSQSENGNREVERVRGGLDSRPEGVLVSERRNDNANRGRKSIGGREGNLFSDRGDVRPGEKRVENGNDSSGSGSREGTSTSGRGTDGLSDGRGGGTNNTSSDNSVGTAVRGTVSVKEEKRELGSDKLSYRPHNTAFSLESVAPAAMVEAMDNSLKAIEKEYGDIDTWLQSELGYDTLEKLHKALAAEQVDSVAMAIYQMKQGQGMIIGDQTGVGKGRQMAALIRWAVRQGKKPIFITKDSDLFSDIYRDLVDVGSGELKPFIFNDKGPDKKTVKITDSDGNVVYTTLSKSNKEKIWGMDKLPDEYDYAILSYTQMNTGDSVSQEESGKAAKEKGKWGAKKGKAVKAGRGTPKADFLRRIAKDNYLLMDESHNAAGEGNTGAYFQSILKDAKAVTFASATFAKRPDTMPLYAIRTAISKAKVKTWELIQMISKGGVTLQEIMSRAMTQAGQMVRRERDMSDVKTDWKTVSDKATAEKARRNYDNVMRAFNAIIDFQDNYIKPALAAKSMEFASMASTVSERRGTKKAGIENPDFVNRLFNFSKQLLLSLKVDAVVDEVVKEIEAGRHPVIALENTLESALEDYSVGDVIEDPTLFGKLKKGLDACFRYTIKNEDGDEIGGELQPHELGEDGERAYNELVDIIQEYTQGMFISPLDAIIEKLEAKGFRVGEISGRNTIARLNDDGKYEVYKRNEKDRKKVARDFNNGDLDVIIINKSGSTGISLHASERKSVRDKRQRTMIMAQPLSDINDYMQMIGRIDRTGQVHRGYYINLGLPVPAETRFMMMLANKLKSLNANTTTSQENKDNDVDAPDLLNKYGDQVMIEYLRDNPDVYRKLGEFLKSGRERGSEGVSAAQLDEYQPKEGDARQITGRVALLSVDEQDAFYDDVTRRYNELIKYLNDTGSNDLKISVLPLNARTIAKEVSSEGTAPNSNNPFADNAYVEWVEMDILKKPMKATEVGKLIEQLNPEGRIDQIIATVEKETQEKLDKENERYEAAKKRAEEDIEAKTEAINKQQKRTPEQKKEAIDKYASEKRQAVEESHQNMVNKIDANHDRLMKYLKMFMVGDSVLVPDDLTTDAFLGSSNGIFCGFKCKDDNITPSTTLAVFATLDGRRKIEVKLSDWGALTRIDNMTQQNYDAAYEVTLSNWDEKIPSSSRKKGYIMTGNILQAISDTNFQGRLVTFTDNQGNVRDGVLMPDKWEPNQLKGATVPISARKERITGMPMKESVTSSDGRVTITRYWGFYTLEVPKSKKQGGEFYLDKALLDLVEDNDFISVSGKMRARVDNSNIDAVVDRLGEMSVTLPSDRKVEFGNEEESINTSDPMEAITQAANSWRRSAKESESSLIRSADTEKTDGNSVPLERRTLKSYTDKDGNYHKGIEEELRELEGEISRRSSGENQEGGSEVDRASRNTQSRRPVNELRRQAAKLRAEIARRERNKSDLRTKYNIDEKGNISLDDLRRLFHDLNTNKIFGKLFDKVCDIVEKLNTQFRFTNKLEALTGGEAFGFFNTTFFNWDSFVRDRTDQQKAKTILHELIHNIANQLLDRYSRTDLPSSVPELTASQKKLAKEIFDIYEVVDKAIPADENGKREFYGATDAYEMLSEMANPEFRKKLSTIPYRKGMSILQRIVEWFKDVLGSFGLDYKGNTAFDSLSKALEDVIGNYDEEGIREYREIIERPVRAMRAAGLTGDVIDYVERYELNGGGTASLVEDEELIKKLDAEPKITVYRAMQLQDGKLYPPMAAKINGKWQDPLPLGKWSQADEHPELVDKNGKFDLDKGNGKQVKGVVYAPYMHGSTTMLNDQFKEAQDRPELVVVEAEMPESELTSGYQAEKSPRKTGMLDWKAGTIQGQLTGTRQVMLSRWVKPVRIVPSSEVAASIKQMIDGQVEVMPTNVVTPEQREELEKLGVKFVKTDNKEIIQEGEHKGEQYSDAYGKKSKRSTQRKTTGNGGKKFVDGDPMQAIKDAASKWARSKAEREGMTPEAHSVKAVYDERLNRVETVFTEAYQDSMIALKTAQNAIAKDKDIPDSQNAYMAENLMHGKNKNEQDLYNKMFRDPLIATINKIMNLTGMNWGDIDRYVYTKSGLERNREFYVRDWLEGQRSRTAPHSYEDLNDAEQSIYDVFAARIEEDFEDGTIATEEEKQKKLSQALQKAHEEYVNQIEQEWLATKSAWDTMEFPEYLESLDNFIRRTIDYDYESSEHDYSGFRAMFGDEEGKYDEVAIIYELMETEAQIDDNPDGEPSGTVAELWERIRESTRYGLERYRESGMRSDEQIDRVEQMFHWYVPMRGFKDDTGEDMYQYFTGKAKSKSYVGGLLKHAKGRGSEANYPISTIFAMTYKAIADCNQNLVCQKLYRLCQANQNDLVILSDSWAVLNEVTGEWEESAPEIPEDATEEDVREITLAWEEQMRQLALEDKAKKIKGKEHFDYKPMDKKKQSEHIVDVRINGQPRKMIVTGNPRMAQAINGQLRFEHGRNIFSKWNNYVKNKMATFFTSYSPTFALRNMFRDWTHFRSMLGVREGHGYAKQANKYYRQSLFKIVGLFKKYREGTLDESKEMERDFKDFMDNGGITGFVFMQKIDDIQKEMEDIYKKQKAGKPIRVNNNLWEKILGAVEALNEGIENNARFATYRTSRHYAQRTKARSAYDAKEITVNFNRKGAGSKTAGFKSTNKRVEDAAKAFGITSQILGEGRIFFNATVQAIATTFKNFQNADGSLNKPYIAKWAAKYALPPFMFGLALPMINKALAAAFGGDGDDDPYANLPEWTRRQNVCIYIGGDNFITIPVGQELAAFLSLGDIFAGNTYAPDLKPVDRDLTDEMIGVMNTFSPVDVSTKITKGGLTEDPVDEVVGRTFSTLAPLVAVGQNLGWTGRPIYREDKFQNDQYTPEYQMVYQSTNPVLVNASKLLHEIGGGDDITRGKFEVNPAIIQYLWEQYTGGPGKVFSNTISLGKDAKDILSGNESDFNIRKVEGLKAFVQQGDDRTEFYRTQAKYRKYKDDASRLYDAVKGYESGAAENPEYLLKLEQISKGEDFVRMQIVREADKTLSQINKAANKAEGKERKELRRLYNEQVNEIVRLLDEVGE